MVEVKGVEGVYERLFHTNDNKDVEIMLSDGLLWAHSNILGANSEAIQGMLKHGSAAKEMKLDWKEHSVLVGQFILRLMYTGEVVAADWSSIDDNEDEGNSVPLQLVLGGLAIAKVYMVEHLLQTFTEALQTRITAETFNTICTYAVKYDVTALRLYCLQVVCKHESNDLVVTGCGLPEFNGVYCPDGTKAGKTSYRKKDGGEHTICWSEYRPVWRFGKNYGDIWYKVRSDADVPPAQHWHVGPRGTAPAPCICIHSLRHSIKKLYDELALAPEVMAELAPIFGAKEPLAKRRRTV